MGLGGDGCSSPFFYRDPGERSPCYAPGRRLLRVERRVDLADSAAVGLTRGEAGASGGSPVVTGRMAGHTTSAWIFPGRLFSAWCGRPCCFPRLLLGGLPWPTKPCRTTGDLSG